MFFIPFLHEYLGRYLSNLSLPHLPKTSPKKPPTKEPRQPPPSNPIYSKTQSQHQPTDLTQLRTPLSFSSSCSWRDTTSTSYLTYLSYIYLTSYSLLSSPVPPPYLVPIDYLAENPLSANPDRIKERSWALGLGIGGGAGDLVFFGYRIRDRAFRVGKCWLSLCWDAEIVGWDLTSTMHCQLK